MSWLNSSSCGIEARQSETPFAAGPDRKDQFITPSESKRKRRVKIRERKETKAQPHPTITVPHLNTHPLVTYQAFPGMAYKSLWSRTIQNEIARHPLPFLRTVSLRVYWMMEAPALVPLTNIQMIIMRAVCPGWPHRDMCSDWHHTEPKLEKEWQKNLL